MCKSFVMKVPRRGYHIDPTDFDEVFIYYDGERVRGLNEYGPRVDFKICNDEDTVSKLKNIFIYNEFIELKMLPGQYYPRIARPGSVAALHELGETPDINDELTRSRIVAQGQLRALVGKLLTVCEVVHPEGDNLHSYGNDIRNLLILACTEFEVHCRNIMISNEYSSKCFRTNDYVKINGPLRLEEYGVVLDIMPWLGLLSPFEGWYKDTPTKSLVWYDAYNAVKHDRERNFKQAKLVHVINSVVACYIMLCAQYGNDFVEDWVSSGSPFFNLVKKPNWDVDELYVPPFRGAYSKVFLSFL